MAPAVELHDTFDRRGTVPPPRWQSDSFVSSLPATHTNAPHEPEKTASFES